MDDKKLENDKGTGTRSKNSFACENLSFAAKEAYKRLRANIMIALPEEDGKCHVIGVTSAQPSEGKSLTALNTAYSIAESGKRVLLIDADMRRPSIHQKIGIALSPGLRNLLTDTNSVGAVVQKYSGCTAKMKFDIIPGGDIPDNPSELLNSTRMSRLLQVLAAVYDYIIIDLPPVGAVIDAVSVSKSTDGMIVVIREQNCPQPVLADCVEQLKYAKVNILGFVINGALEGAGKKYQYGSYSYS